MVYHGLCVSMWHIQILNWSRREAVRVQMFSEGTTTKTLDLGTCPTPIMKALIGNALSPQGK